MKQFALIFFLIFIFISLKVEAFENGTDSLLVELENNIALKDSFVQNKFDKIEGFIIELKKFQSTDNKKKAYNLSEKIYNEYVSFIYDSAFKYAEVNLKYARLIGDHDKLVRSKINLGFVLLSSGLFKESLDTLLAVSLGRCSDSLKFEYYNILARTYFDLGDFVKDHYFTQKYFGLGRKYSDSALVYTAQGTLEFYSTRATKLMKSDDFIGATADFDFILKNFTLTNHQYAIVYSSLGYLNNIQNKQEIAIQMLIRAALADITASTMETVALRNLSEILYQTGDIKLAYKYIKLALDDATFYNARHRKIEIATILPIIEGEKLSTTEKQRALLQKYAVTLGVLVFLVLVFASIILGQLKRLRKAKQIIQLTNFNLTHTNSKLLEANKIKEEYIGYYFNVNSEYIDKIEKFLKDVKRKIATNRFEEIENTIRNIDLKREREELFHSFDKVFLKLFPDFIQSFNALFKVEDRIVLHDDQLLNTDLRIFALIRMGITDNEKIAKILEYSVNTIYTYKTKIKNKSIVPNDQFEEKIMEIKAV